MTGSPFSNVVGHDPDDSTFTDVEATETTDTTSASAVARTDTPTEPAPGVIQTPQGPHVAGQDETPGDAPSGQ